MKKIVLVLALAASTATLFSFKSLETANTVASNVDNYMVNKDEANTFLSDYEKWRDSNGDPAAIPCAIFTIDGPRPRFWRCFWDGSGRDLFLSVFGAIASQDDLNVAEELTIVKRL